MSVLIGVASAVTARYAEFSKCLANLEKPEGSETKFAYGIDIGENRNSVARHALAHSFEWVFFVDDDMVFAPDHLERLLAHNQPVVASLYLNRKPPHYPVAYNESTIVQGQRVWRPVSLDGAPQEGLAEIVAAGTGGMLINTDVFRAIEHDTWFDHHQSTDDLAFCQRVIDAGFPIYLDLAAAMGHISTYEVWPLFTGKDWSGDVRFSPGHSINVELGS